jgi:hypothetical protein
MVKGSGYELAEKAIETVASGGLNLRWIRRERPFQQRSQSQ